MFFIVNDTKSFMKPECFVSQTSAMMHPYKWTIVDVLSGKNIVSIVHPSSNKLWRVHGILFDIGTIRKWVKK